ncbi:MAG: hypothetical protein K9H49_02305 [Bacteroidales bacterium]|nr:hypothetical protein [Bacteroidales bacterium]MCF8403401.1 hypothetical protein [Bacteroidales bacterium]
MKKFKNYQHFILFASLLIVLISSCRKEEEIATDESYKITLSSDTILFDTVFTTVGSTTKYLKLYNQNDRKINISSIRLAGGENSQFRVNVDGESGTSFSNIELDKDDSLYVFIKVTVDPTLSNAPLVVTDSVVFETNGNIQDVDLVAWGQDAHFFVGNKRIEGLSYPYTLLAEEGETINWQDDKPYVIYGWGVVDSAAQLIIGPGVDIHFHQNSGLWVYRGGNIIVNGEKDSLVTFQGDRLEYEYQDLPGQWDRIWINEGSINNEFNYAIIKNGYIGLQSEILISDENLQNALILNNTIIQSMSRWGLFSIAYNIVSTNSVFADCAENTLFISVGGNYDFRHCTFSNYWTGSIRQDPSFTLSNNLIVQDGQGNFITYLGNLNAYFGNCIIWGILDEEIVFSNDESTEFNYVFDHCLLKTLENISDEGLYPGCFKNNDPLFVDYTINDYRLDTLSAASDRGSIDVINNSIFELSNDLDGNSRISDEAPDLGAYEFIPIGKKI